MSFEKIVCEVIFWLLLAACVFSLKPRGFEEWWINALFVLFAIGSILYGVALSHNGFFEKDEGLVFVMCEIMVFAIVAHCSNVRYRFIRRSKKSKSTS